MDVILEIQQKYTSFSEKEKNIAEYVLEHSRSINNINIADLAKITQTSGATVTRFCRKIGCANFVDMKLKLSALKKEEPEPESGILTAVYSYYNKAIEGTQQSISKEQIVSVVEEIKKARKIYIYGVGSSGLTALEMMQRLLRMGFNVHGIADPHMMIINSAIAGKGDLVIGLSVSGETQEVVSALRIAKNNGARTIAISSFANSALAQQGDIPIIVYNSLFVDKKRFINSQFSAMYLMDLLSMVLLENERLSQKMQRTIDAITKE